MKIYSVLGSPNDLSQPVYSVWSTREKAEVEMARLQELYKHTCNELEISEWTLDVSDGAEN